MQEREWRVKGWLARVGPWSRRRGTAPGQMARLYAASRGRRLQVRPAPVPAAVSADSGEVLEVRVPALAGPLLREHMIMRAVYLLPGADQGRPGHAAAEQAAAVILADWHHEAAGVLAPGLRARLLLLRLGPLHATLTAAVPGAVTAPVLSGGPVARLYRLVTEIGDARLALLAGAGALPAAAAGPGRAAVRQVVRAEAGALATAAAARAGAGPAPRPGCAVRPGESLPSGLFAEARQLVLVQREMRRAGRLRGQPGWSGAAAQRGPIGDDLGGVGARPGPPLVRRDDPRGD